MRDTSDSSRQASAATREELITSMVDALEPWLPKDQCRSEIEGMLPDLEQAFCVQTGIAPPGVDRNFAALAAQPPPTAKERRDAHNEIVAALERVARAYENFPEATTTVIRQETLSREVRLHRDAADHIKVRRTRHDGYAKSVCAAYAFQLTQGFSTKKPTATPGGAYLETAGILWELLTGERDISLERHCRDTVIKARRLPPPSK